MTTPQLADFGVVATHGNLRGRLIAGTIQYLTDGTRNHAILYVGNGEIIEGEPGGCRLSKLDRYNPDDIVWSTGRLPARIEAQLTPTARAAIARKGRGLEHTPYGYWDVALVALAQKRMGTVIHPEVPISEQPWPWRQVLGYLADTGRMDCSHIVDVAYNLGGVKLYDDNRFPGMVSPADEYRLLTPAGITA